MERAVERDWVSGGCEALTIPQLTQLAEEIRSG